MDVSIIFVNYKTKDLTINAIKSVIEKTEGIEYEIFVVDNNSQDGSIEAIEQEFPNINIVKNPINAGFGAANNLAIKQAMGKYILCLNTDTLLINNAIKIMYDFMEKEENGGVGACGGQLYDKDLVKQPCVGHYTTLMTVLLRPLFKFEGIALNFEHLINPNFDCAKADITHIHGANIFLRKKVLDKLGAFDERFFMYGEDVDLCKKISDSGCALKYVPDAKIVHFEGKSYNIKIKRQKQCITGLFLYFKKYYNDQIILLKILYLIGYLYRFLFVNRENGKEMLKFVWSIK